MAMQDLVGSWQLLEYRLILGENTVFPLGPKPQGIIIYSADGFMSANLMKPGAKPHEESWPHEGTVEERANSMLHTLTYAGTYSVSESPEYPDRIVVKHHVQVSALPNWVGGVQARLATLSEDMLVLETLNLDNPNPAHVSYFLPTFVAGGKSH